MRSSTSTHSQLLFLLSVISSVCAQFVQPRRRRTSIGRVVAGAVVGGIAVLALLIFCCVMFSRRRRMRQNYPVEAGTTNPVGPQSQWNKPMFGGGGIFGGGSKHPQTPFSPTGYNDQAPYAQQQSFAAPQGPPPPGYNNNNGGHFAPPQGPPPAASHEQKFAAPPGPPPAAHTTGQDGNFVGGFRS